jgi:hypothetical protein
MTAAHQSTKRKKTENYQTPLSLQIIWDPWIAHLVDSWLHEIVDQRVVNGLGDLHPPAVGIAASQH